jgi:hypothetical protein
MAVLVFVQIGFVRQAQNGNSIRERKAMTVRAGQFIFLPLKFRRAAWTAEQSLQ